LFSDPPEFGILYARKTQQYSNYVRLLLGVLAFILVAKQTTESPIQCLHVMNSTISPGTKNLYILETCLDDIKSDNGFIILDEFFGWLLAIEIICLMFISKTIARNERSKQICKRFTDLGKVSFKKIHFFQTSPPNSNKILQ